MMMSQPFLFRERSSSETHKLQCPERRDGESPGLHGNNRWKALIDCRYSVPLT